MNTVQDGWFEYAIAVQPQHTDYAGVVWHGSYIAWLEAARIATLKAVGVQFSDLVTLGCDLPVVELTIKYKSALQLGDMALVRSRLEQRERARLIWAQNIVHADSSRLCVSTTVVLVPVNRQKQRVLRHLPALLSDAVDQLLGGHTAIERRPQK